MVTETYGVIALLKQRGQNFQSHMQHCGFFFSPIGQILTLLFALKNDMTPVENKRKGPPRHYYIDTFVLFT